MYLQSSSSKVAVLGYKFNNRECLPVRAAILPFDAISTVSTFLGSSFSSMSGSLGNSKRRHCEKVVRLRSNWSNRLIDKFGPLDIRLRMF